MITEPMPVSSQDTPKPPRSHLFARALNRDVTRIGPSRRKHVRDERRPPCLFRETGVCVKYSGGDMRKPTRPADRGMGGPRPGGRQPAGGTAGAPDGPPGPGPAGPGSAGPGSATAWPQAYRSPLAVLAWWMWLACAVAILVD